MSLLEKLISNVHIWSAGGVEDAWFERAESWVGVLAAFPGNGISWAGNVSTWPGSEGSGAGRVAVVATGPFVAAGAGYLAGVPAATLGPNQAAGVPEPPVPIWVQL